MIDKIKAFLDVILGETECFIPPQRDDVIVISLGGGDLFTCDLAMLLDRQSCVPLCDDEEENYIRLVSLLRECRAEVET
jgi:hypothetical protein